MGALKVLPMSKKSPLMPSSDELPLLGEPEAITRLLEGVLATSFTFSDPRASDEVRMLESLREDLLGAVDVWPRLDDEERRSVTAAFAEHLGRLADSGWALAGERQSDGEGGTVLRFHVLRQPPRRRVVRERYGLGGPRGLLH